MTPKPSKVLAPLVILAVLAVPNWALAQDEEAAAARFQKRLDALLAACQAEQKGLRLGTGEALYRKYPTPEIKLTRPLRVTPGGTTELVLPGQKTAGTRVLFETDELSVEKESSGGSGYRATVRASAGAGPGSAIMHVYAPVSCATDQRTVYVGGRYEWDLKGSNGWLIRVRTVDERLGGGQEPSLVCKADFSKGGGQKPFVTRDLVVRLPRLPERHYSLATPDRGASQPAIDQSKMNELLMKMMDAKTSPAERARAQKELEQITGSAQARAQQVLKGCSHIELELGAGGAVKGEAQCEGGATIQVTGTMRLAGT